MRRSALLPFALLGAAASGEDAGPAAPSPDPEIQRMVSDVSAERIQRSIFVLGSFKTRHTLSDPAPSGDGIGGAGAWIRAEFVRASAPSRGRLRVELDEFKQKAQPPLLPRPAKIANIVATLPSSLPAATHCVYVICAHYDSRVKDPLDYHSAAPGADDDASGVAAVLEAARVMCPYDFKATLVFLVTSAEEQGLYGAAHWADEAKRDGLTIAGVINDDMIGNTHGLGDIVDRKSIRLFAQGIPAPQRLESAAFADGGENDTPPRELARAVRELAIIYAPAMTVRIIFRADRFLRQGDQMAFLERGYPAVRLTEAVEDYRHQDQYAEFENGVAYGDTPDSIDYGYVANAARVNTAALAGLGRAPASPRSVEMETDRLDQNTTLRWAPNMEEDLAGYRVVWRETIAPYWEHSRDLGKNTTRTTLRGLSKDDLIFGVEAFDAAGHFSAAVFPQPTKR